MGTRTRAWVWGLSVLALHGCLGPGRERWPGGEPPPNLVFILADDLGAMDLGCTGSRYYETPHLDALARSGVRFTQAYSAAPNCAPTRAAIQSGLYGPRTGVYTVQSGARGKAENRRLVPPENRPELLPRFLTVAERLRDAGYRTAHVGKWHLGNEEQGTAPQMQGYDLNVAGAENGHPAGYFWPYDHRMPGLEGGGEGEYLTDRLTDEAIAFVRRNRRRPFFLHLAYYAVHTPIEAKAELEARFDGKPPHGGQGNPAFAAMIASLDENVGRLLAELERLGLAERTVVVFTSDNGGVGGYERAGVTGMREITDNAPLRGGKGMLYEGGIRVPLLVRQPGVTMGGSDCDVPVTSVDFLPTLCELAGDPLGPQAFCDGRSLVPLLRGERPEGLVERELYWHFPGYLQAQKDGLSWRTTPAAAIRSGRWKWLEFYETGHGELYDLARDVGEERERSAEEPERTALLRERLLRWQERVQAPFATLP